ncbi:MAG: hypothetical protein M3Y59_01865 [Myxococcota bacterium]|nr:hypothetical protein [Myxococcota bacterium]
MNSDDVYRNYLHDLGILIKEMALEAKVKAAASGDSFDVGYMAGFHRVVSLMQQQGEAFGVPMKAIGLDGIDPDQELV